MQKPADIPPPEGLVPLPALEVLERGERLPFDVGGLERADFDQLGEWTLYALEGVGLAYRYGIKFEFPCGDERCALMLHFFDYYLPKDSPLEEITAEMKMATHGKQIGIVNIVNIQLARKVGTKTYGATHPRIPEWMEEDLQELLQD
tara:strand:+ start:2131 stop:2571 length:441 start_codon:yes stop_codon:yes gene_type:complete